MNVQYALKDGEIYVLEVNPRASRTVPFVAKVIGEPIAKIAARIMAGEQLAGFGLKPWEARPCRGEGGGVSLRPLPGRRYRARSGNALDRRGHRSRPLVRNRLRQEPARRRHQSADHGHASSSRCAMSTSRGCSRPCELLAGLGFRIFATGGTRALSREPGHCRRRGSTRSRKGARMWSTPSRTAASSSCSTPPRAPRRSPIPVRCAAPPCLHKVPYYTTLAGAIAAAQGIRAYHGR